MKNISADRPGNAHPLKCLRNTHPEISIGFINGRQWRDHGVVSLPDNQPWYVVVRAQLIQIRPVGISHHTGAGGFIDPLAQQHFPVSIFL